MKITKIDVKKILTIITGLALFVGISVIIGIVSVYALIIVEEIGASKYALPLTIISLVSIVFIEIKKSMNK